jgi:hypothetical protein
MLMEALKFNNSLKELTNLHSFQSSYVPYIEMNEMSIMMCEITSSWIVVNLQCVALYHIIGTTRKLQC